MRYLLLSILALLLLAIGCSSGDSDSPTTPDPGQTPEATATIGAEGGDLADDGFVLEVPAGLLSAPTDLALYLEEDEEPTAGDAAAPVYRLEGLTDGLAAPMRVRLQHGAGDADSLRIALGLETYVTSLDSTIVAWSLPACTDSSGWALFALPPVLAAPGKADAPVTVRISAVTGMASITSEYGNFEITWSPSQASTAEVEVIAAGLETALGTYDFMGYEQAGFAGWPVAVAIESMKPSYFGYFSPSRTEFGGSMAFNANRLWDAEEMKLTAAHELFHFCQYFYDPRTPAEIGTRRAPHVWFMEATATWVEHIFSDDENYCSAAFVGREMNPLNGVVPAASDPKPGAHGYGLASLIQYLTETDDYDIVLSSFEAIKTGTHALLALDSSTTVSIPDIWADYLDELVLGNIYDEVTVSDLFKYPADIILSARSSADTTATSSLMYPDLSGQTHWINWPTGYLFPSDAFLRVWCDDPEYHLSVFGVKEPATITRLGAAYGPVQLSGLRDRQAAYDGLLVLVSNQQMEGPDYNGTTGLTLQARVRESLDLGKYDTIQVNLTYHATWFAGSSTYDTYAQEMNFSSKEGTFDGTSFVANWNYDALGTNYSGSMTVTLSTDDYHAVSWSASEVQTYETTIKSFGASGTILGPAEIIGGVLTTRLDGEGTCASISEIHYTNSTDGEITRNLESWTCNTSSDVRVTLRETD